MKTFMINNNKLHMKKMIGAVALGVVLLTSVASSSHAADRHGRGQAQAHGRRGGGRRDWDSHEGRSHRDWDRRGYEPDQGVIYAPPVVYAPPPAYEEPGINFILPLHIR